MKTKSFSLACALLIILALATPALSAPPAVTDPLRAFGVVPPGQNGFVTLGDVLGGTHRPHAVDQLDLYAGLIDDNDVTEDELDDHFKSLQFGPGATIEDEYKPRPDVTVYRDGFGVPHIYGDTDQAAFFATGYVAAEDRLWEMDLFRHAANGQLASLLGEGDGRSYLTNDELTRRDGYTSAELDQMLGGLSDDFGADGQLVEDGVKAYVEGVNARIAEVKADPSLVPAEYQGAPITDWAPSDVAALAVFQLRDFGDTGGAELFGAALLDQLSKKFGASDAFDSYYDFLMPSDPNTYTTIPASEGQFASQNTGRIKRDALALPDNPAKLLRQVYGERRAAAAVQKVLGYTPEHQSNFLAVSADSSATGHPLEFGAPQVGYTIPQFFMEIDVHSPGLDFRGPSVPGVSLLVPLGRGIDYAWSLTTGSSDNVDTWMEQLCKPGGGKPSLDSDHYMHNGQCRAMDERAETISVKTAIGGQESHELTVQRTVHGPVRARTTVDGKPVAVTQGKAFWMHEADSIVAFSRLNGHSVTTADDFIATMRDGSMSFNSVFVNHDQIAYMHSGRYPLRAAGVDGNLPVWGTGKWDWKGYVDPGDLPHLIDPKQGWFANWNNRPSAGWRGGDSSIWGPTQRVKLLANQMNDLLGAGKATLSDVVDVIRTAATQDGRAVIVGPRMLASLSNASGASASARDVIADWVAQGAHRYDLDDDGDQDFGPAVVVFDDWYDRLVHRVFDDELNGHYGYLGLPISDDPRTNNGSSFYSDASNYLWNLFGSDTRRKLARDYCDDIGTPKKETCASQARKAMTSALAALRKAHGSEMATWTKPVEKLHFSAIGGAGVADIDWQNRGTWNHAVEVTGSR
jgi:acyl-homoserine lactone acylase PvdQ